MDQPVDEIHQTILNSVDPQNIRKHLNYLTKEQHIAGTQRDVELAHYIFNLWVEQGLDDVKLVPYTVLLTYPNPELPNSVIIIDENGGVNFECRHQEAILDEKYIQPFNAYSPKGDVIAEPLYVNYGRVEDFDYLEKQGIEISGKICLIRYGKIYRGKKVSNAAKRGAVGVVLFLCQSDVAVDGTDSSNTYPNTWWMPGDAIQRGDIREEKGDPQTPGYPALNNVYRIPVEQINSFPKIPCQPIGYEDANTILQQLDGTIPPGDWTAAENVRIGPGFKERTKKLRLVVNNEFKQEICYNVIASIKGAVESDRYVLLGNHRDAWVYGGADPSSGTAQMCEVSRVFGALKKDGWKPNRTILFSSWGGEEFGLIGSSEWVEEHLHILTERAIAYINVDICAAGDSFHPESSAMLEDFVYEMAGLVPDPKQPDRSVRDVWKKSTQESRVHALGPGTDHIPFYFYAGISAINLSWLVDKIKYPTLFLHPAYHTAYDNFDMIDRLIDPGFKIHQACARLCCLLLYRLSNCALLPYNICRLAERIDNSWLALQNQRKKQIQDLGLTVDHVEKALDDFKTVAKNWMSRLDAQDLKNSLVVRQINDQLMLTEKIFIQPGGTTEISILRHVMFTPHGNTFPNLINSLDEHLVAPGNVKTKQLIEKNLSDIMIALRSATNVLKFPDTFY